MTCVYIYICMYVYIYVVMRIYLFIYVCTVQMIQIYTSQNVWFYQVNLAQRIQSHGVLLQPDVSVAPAPDTDELENQGLSWSTHVKVCENIDDYDECNRI